MAFVGKSYFSNNVNANTIQCIPQDIEVPEAPSDAVSSLRFSPAAFNQTLLLATSWDKTAKIWEISNNGQISPRLQQTSQAPLLDSCWLSDGTKAFICGADKAAYAWDFTSNQLTQVAAHDAPIKTIHHIQSPNYSILMTGSWDKKLRFWDMRSPSPTYAIDLPERVYAADVVYPMAVVALANREIIVYNLEKGVTEFKKLESQLKYQSRCVSIFLDKNNSPSGYALGSLEGRVGIQSLTTNNAKDTFTFKCHRSPVNNSNMQDIYSVNDLTFHPQYQTLATVGSDGNYNFWDKDARTKLKGMEPTEKQPITCCAIDSKGQIFGYAFGYDWSKGHEYNIVGSKKPRIFLHPCGEEMRPQKK